MDAARKPKRKRADKKAKDDEVGGVAEIAKKMKPKQQQPPKQQPANPNAKVKKNKAEAMTAAGVAALPNPNVAHQSAAHMAKMRAERDEISAKKREKETKEMEDTHMHYILTLPTYVARMCSQAPTQQLSGTGHRVPDPYPL